MRALIVGDACVSTGFAKGTHAYADGLVRAGYEVHVLGMHYTGDPHPYPYPIYTTWPGGDQFGIGRIANIVKQTDPDVIIIQQDPWNFSEYMGRLHDVDKPIIGVVAVDGKNCSGRSLNGLAMAVFWTKFGEYEAKIGGYAGKSAVIPLGVDLDTFKPMDRAAVRKELLGPIFEKLGMPMDTFVVGAVGRNQERKRLDLTIQYFAEWTQAKDVRDAVLWMHVAPTGDDAFNIKQLAAYFGVKGRVLVPDINPRYGVAEEILAKVYNLFDVYLSTTLGEGMGLTAMEAMASGVACVLPKWSAYGEWAAPAAWLAECNSISVAPKINTVGGVVGNETIKALSRLRNDPHARETLSKAGIKLMAEPQYRWEAVGDKFAEVVTKTIRPVTKHEPLPVSVEEEAVSV